MLLLRSWHSQWSELFLSAEVVIMKISCAASRPPEIPSHPLREMKIVIRGAKGAMLVQEGVVKGGARRVAVHLLGAFFRRGDGKLLAKPLLG